MPIHSRQINVADGTTATVNAGDGVSDGSGDGIALKNHQHGVATAVPAASSVSAAAPAEGSGADLMRSDAGLQADISGTLDSLAAGQSGSDGTGNGLALKTHAHAAPTGEPLEITDSTNDVGEAGTFADAEHQHSHGNRSGGALHADATGSVAGFMTAVDKTKLDTLQDAAGIDAKESCRVKTQGNITLSGEQTIDGILTAGDRVLVSEQATGSQDGIYLSGAGAWTREDDAAAGSEARGWVVPIEEGAVSGDKGYLCTNNEGADIVGTDDLIFLIGFGGDPRGAGDGLILSANDLDVVANADGSIVANANDIQVGILATDAQHGVRGGGTQHADVVAAGADGFMTGADKTILDGIEAGATAETPQQETVTTENITNSDTALTDTLNATPKDNAWVRLYLNGVFQRQGATFDYTISGTTITWLASSGTAVNMKTIDTLDAVYVS